VGGGGDHAVNRAARVRKGALALAVVSAVAAGMVTPACSSSGGGDLDEGGRPTKVMPCGASVEGAMVIVPAAYCPSFLCSGDYAYAVCVGGVFGECNCGGSCVLVDGASCDFPDVMAPLSPEGGPDTSEPPEDATLPSPEASSDAEPDVLDFDDGDDGL
jgi:hypothetical protein